MITHNGFKKKKTAYKVTYNTLKNNFIFQCEKHRNEN